MLEKNLDLMSNNINLINQNIFSEMEIIHLTFETGPKYQSQSIFDLNFRKRYAVIVFSKFTIKHFSK